MPPRRPCCAATEPVARGHDRRWTAPTSRDPRRTQVLDAARALVADRSRTAPAEVEAARRVPARPARRARRRRLPADAAAAQPRRGRRRPAGRAAVVRDAGRCRRLGGLDGDDRRQRVDRPRRAAPRHVRRALRETTDVVVAGAFAPSGSIIPVDGGYRVTGRWGFVSGCEHATWLYGNCVEATADGVPQLRIAVFAPDQVQIEDTWTVLGLLRDRKPPHPRHRRSCTGRPDPASAGRRAVPRRAGGPHPAAFAARADPSPAWRSASRRGRWPTPSPRPASKVPLLARRTGMRRPGVPGRPGDGRHGPAGGPRAAVRVGRGGVGDRRGRRAVHAAATGAGPGGRGLGDEAGGGGRRDGLPQRRRDRGLPELPTAAPPARRPRR